MKNYNKTFFIIVFLFSLLITKCNAQRIFDTRLQQNQYTKINNQSVVYDVDAENYFSRLPNTINNSKKILINNRIIAFKSAQGISSLSQIFDILIIEGGIESKANALINVVDNGIVPTEVNTLLWNDSTGLASNGTTSYINYNYNPAVDAVNYSQNSNCFFSYETGNGEAEDGWICGATTGVLTNGMFWRQRRIANDNTYIGINGAFFGVISPAPANGFFSCARLAVNSSALYHEGISYATDVSASTGPESFVLYGFTNNFLSGFQTKTQGVFGVCGGTVDQVALSDFINGLASDLGFHI